MTEYASQDWPSLPPLSALVNKVHNVDALSLLAALPDGCVDAVISDFPYNTTACEWETDIGLSTQLWNELWRVVKDNGAVITTASQPFTSLITMNQLNRFRHEWIWEKSLATGYLNANRAPMKAHESILVFSKQAPNYYPQKVTGKPYRATNGAVGGYVHDKTVGGYVDVSIDHSGRVYIDKRLVYTPKSLVGKVGAA